MGGGGGKSKKPKIGYKYFLGLHMIICISEGSAIVTGIHAGGKKFSGGLVTPDGLIEAYAPDLFGGKRKEGGIVGDIDIMSGAETQGQNSYLQEQIGVNVPSFRGVLSAVAKKCYVCAINPYPKPWWFEVTDIPQEDWFPGTARINPVGAKASANPVHIIRECITNTNWGLGYPFSTINDTAAREAAQTCYDEGFGMSFILTGQQTVEDFLQMILRHINGAIYTDRVTGLFIIKLFRDDYVVGDLPLFDQSNSNLDSYQRPQYAEMVNEVIIKYRKRGNSKDTAITMQDLASIQAQGGVISQTISFPCIDNDDTASKVGERELRQHSTPLAQVNITTNREAWSVNPGDVIKFSWPEEGINQMVLRVIKIDFGELMGGNIKISCMEDIFGLPSSSYFLPTDSEWIVPVPDPAPVAGSKLTELSYFEIATNIDRANVQALEDDDCYLVYAARRGSVATDFILWTSPTAGGTYTQRVGGDFCYSGTLSEDIESYNGSGPFAFSWDGGVTLSQIELNTFAYLGDEMVAITAVNTTTGELTLTRGILDTLPTYHSIGERIWLCDEGFAAFDDEEYGPGETTYGKAQTQTMAAVLDLGLATAESFTFAGRLIRPYPPGGVRGPNSSLFQEAFMTSDWVVYWYHRNRLTQTTRPFIGYNDTSVTTEPGVSYTIRFYGENKLLDAHESTMFSHETTGSTGTSLTWTNETTEEPQFVYLQPNDFVLGARLHVDANLLGSLSPYTPATNITNVSFVDNRAVFNSGYMDVGLFNPSSISFAFSAVISFDVVGSALETIFSKENASFVNQFAIQHQSTLLYIKQNTDTYVLNLPTWIQNNQEFNLTVLVSGDDPLAGQSTVDVFINGVSIGSSVRSTTVTDWSGLEFMLGCTVTSGFVRATQFSGTMKDVVFYNTNKITTDFYPTSRKNDRIKTRVISIRDGHECLNVPSFITKRVGYGYHYGDNYGGGI